MIKYNYKTLEEMWVDGYLNFLKNMTTRKRGN